MLLEKEGGHTMNQVQTFTPTNEFELKDLQQARSLMPCCSSDSCPRQFTVHNANDFLCDLLYVAHTGRGQTYVDW